jgi:hypothetical protein
MNKIKFLLVIIFSFTINYSLSQENPKRIQANNIQYLDNLSIKQTASINDAFALYYFYKYNKNSNFKIHRNAIIELKIIDSDKYNNANLALRRGLLAKIVAVELNLKKSLMYLIFKNERYAYRACIAEEIMSPGKSNNDIISGQELIEIIHILTNLKGRNL